MQRAKEGTKDKENKLQRANRKIKIEGMPDQELKDRREKEKDRVKLYRLRKRD